MTDLDLSALLADMRRLALEAGKVILEIYAQDFDVTHKEDKSPVTLADQKAEDIIAAGLAGAAPGIPVVAEEAVSAGADLVHAARFFLVDPLDGTKSFVRREGEFTVNIALIDHGRPIAGVVLAPAIGRLFYGAGNAAYQEDIDVDSLRAAGAAAKASSPRPIKARRPPKGELIGVVSRSHNSEKSEYYEDHYGVTKLLPSSSSLKFCLVAAGEADIYPRHGRTMEWDTGAGHAVLAAAGGRVDELSGTPLLYGKFAKGLENPHFVARGLTA